MVINFFVEFLLPIIIKILYFVYLFCVGIPILLICVFVIFLEKISFIKKETSEKIIKWIAENFLLLGVLL